MARYGRVFKERAVARLLPPELIRAPRRHSDTIGESDRPPTSGADIGGERLPAPEKVVYTVYIQVSLCANSSHR
jgi:hypothetical protein